MASPPKVGIVTVTYNSGNVIRGFLSSAFKQTYASVVLYVIDNASMDNTLELVAWWSGANIRVIANPDNRGIAEANNQGIQAALAEECDLVLLMNNDTEFEPGLVAMLVNGMNQYECDMVAPKILYFDDPARIWSAGGGMDPRRGYAGFHYGYDEPDQGQFDFPRSVDHAPACCLLIRKQVFEQIGMMDSRYFTYVEDTDFSYRAKMAGMKLMYVPCATVLHKAHSLTGGLFSPFMMRYTTRNRVYFMLKHFGVWKGLYYVPAYQAHLVVQVLSRKVKPSMFWLREKAFFEGLYVWRQSLA